MKQHTRNFFGVWELACVVLGGLFFELLTPSTLGGYNFLNSIPFSTIFNALDAPIGRIQVLFGHQKKWSLPLNLAYLEHLNVIIATQLQLNLQLRNN
jgi:hypothetical protein